MGPQPDFMLFASSWAWTKPGRAPTQSPSLLQDAKGSAPGRCPVCRRLPWRPDVLGVGSGAPRPSHWQPQRKPGAAPAQICGQITDSRPYRAKTDPLPKKSKQRCPQRKKQANPPPPPPHKKKEETKKQKNSQTPPAPQRPEGPRPVQAVALSQPQRPGPRFQRGAGAAQRHQGHQQRRSLEQQIPGAFFFFFFFFFFF